MQVEITSNKTGGWVPAREEQNVGGADYWADWSESMPGKYRITKKTVGDARTYYLGFNEDIAQAITELNADWGNRATLDYKEWTELI